jgi:hypothetical protein
MSDLNKLEKIKLEKLLEMSSGYVLEFSNNTFQTFVLESVGIDIYDSKYDFQSGSKANRLRAFWNKESNYQVGKLTCDILEYWRTKKITSYTEISKPEQELYDECYKIAIRLKQDVVVENIEVIQGKDDDRDFKLLAKLIRDSIERNEPETALDRLHTYIFKFVRQLCDLHKIEYTKEESLNAIFGKYVKHIINTGLIESAMSEKILKYSINVLEAFNDVRNNKSLAHDNSILNYSESILIFNNVTNAIKFIQTIEEKYQSQKSEESIQSEWDELPF